MSQRLAAARRLCAESLGRRALATAAPLLLALVACGAPSEERDPEAAPPAVAGGQSATGAGPGADPGADAEPGEPGAPLERLAADVTSYGAKARLIRIGPPALSHLLAQAGGADEALAGESISTVRWMVEWWKGDGEAAAALAAGLGEFARGPAAADRRSFAVDLLGDLGGEVAVDRLAALLEDPELGVTAILALGRIEGAAARQALTEAVAEATGERRASLYAALGRRAEPESIRFLLAAADDDDAAVAALSGYDDQDVLDWLVAAAAKGSDAALAALLATDAAGRDGRLLARAADAASGDDRAAVAARVRWSDQYDPALVEALLDLPTRGELGRARDRALLTLAPRMEPQAAASVALEALSRSRDATVVVPALRVCAELCPPTAAEEVGESLASGDPEIRLAAVDALSRMAGGRASIELHAAIRAASPAAARPMIAALGRRHDREAAEALLELTRSPAEGLGAELLAASLAMAPALEDQTLAAAVWARSLDLRITEEAIAGLGRVGTAAQVPRLEKVLEGSSGTLYEATRAALVGIGRRLASAGEAGPAIAALEVAFRHGAPVEGDLRRLGRRVDLVAHGGRIDAWWWLAAAASPQTCATAGPPGAQLEALGSSGDPAPWRPIEAADSRGAVEIGRAASGAGVLWLAADVEPRAAAPIGILVRSGAAVALWLDGRALAPDPPDGGEAARYAARLGEGTSRLVARLCAPSPEALLVLQLEDESGRPLKFRIR